MRTILHLYQGGYAFFGVDVISVKAEKRKNNVLLDDLGKEFCF
jgi:hypothetical protein